MKIFIFLTEIEVSLTNERFSTTRLETRTKESNIYASIWISIKINELQMRSESEDYHKIIVVWNIIKFNL